MSEIAEVINRLRRNESGIKASNVFCLEEGGVSDVEMEGLAEALGCNTIIRKLAIHRCYFSLIPFHLHHWSTISATSVSMRLFVTHPSLRTLCLNRNGLTDEHAILIAEALKTNTSLRRLYLNKNMIKSTGFLALLKGLRENKTLEDLHLLGNDIAMFRMTERSKHELSVSIEKSSLKALDLSDIYVGKAGAIAIAVGIQKNKTLMELRLNESSMYGGAGCRAFASALQYNDTLRCLSIGPNHGITNDDVQAAFETSLRNSPYTSLEELYLGSLCREGITAICNRNRHINNNSVAKLPTGLWPRVFELVGYNPDILFKLLSSKPDVCREQDRCVRKRRRPDRFGY